MWYLPAEVDVAEPGFPHDGRFSDLDTAHVADDPASINSSVLPASAAIVRRSAEYALIEERTLLFLPAFRARKDRVVDHPERHRPHFKIRHYVDPWTHRSIFKPTRGYADEHRSCSSSSSGRLLDKGFRFLQPCVSFGDSQQDRVCLLLVKRRSHIILQEKM